jgi:hypothetical protein
MVLPFPFSCITFWTDIVFPASYYTAAPLSLASSCISEAADYLQDQIAEFIVKGRARMPDLVIDSSFLLKPLLKLGWCQWIGAVIFIWGSLHQTRCHAILVSIHFLYCVRNRIYGGILVGILSANANRMFPYVSNHINIQKGSSTKCIETTTRKLAEWKPEGIACWSCFVI